jgi:hypothetical protein
MSEATRKAGKDITNKIYRLFGEAVSETGESSLFGGEKRHLGTVSGNKAEIMAQTEKRLQGQADELGGTVLLERKADGSVVVAPKGTKFKMGDMEGNLLGAELPESVVDPVALEAFKKDKSDTAWGKKWVKAKPQEGVEYLPPTPKELIQHGKGESIKFEEIAKRSGWPDAVNRWLEQPERSDFVRILGGAYGELDPKKQGDWFGSRGWKSFGVPLALGTAMNFGTKMAPSAEGRTGIELMTKQKTLKQLEDEAAKEQLQNLGKNSILTSIAGQGNDWNGNLSMNKSASTLMNLGLDQQIYLKALASVQKAAGGRDKLLAMGGDAILAQTEHAYNEELLREAAILEGQGKKPKSNKRFDAYIKAVREGKTPFFFPPQIAGDGGPDMPWSAGIKSPDGGDSRYLPMIVASGAGQNKTLGSRLTNDPLTTLVYIDTSKKGIEGLTYDNMALSKVNRDAEKKPKTEETK